MCLRNLGGERHWITALRHVCAMLPEQAPCSGLSQPPPAWSRERACLSARPAPPPYSAAQVPLALQLPTTLSPLPPGSVPSSLATATDWSEPGPSSLLGPLYMHVHLDSYWRRHTVCSRCFVHSPLSSGATGCGNGKRGWVFLLERRFISLSIGRETSLLCPYGTRGSLFVWRFLGEILAPSAAPEWTTLLKPESPSLLHSVLLTGRPDCSPLCRPWEQRYRLRGGVGG